MSCSLKSVDAAVQKRGRKPAGESRAAEIRTKLMAWRQMPEAFRSSLRVLAAEIGTSHQLLSFYLRRWHKWRQKDYRRKANDIRARAETENRTMTHQEQAQVAAYERAAFQSMIDSVVRDTVTTLRKEARCGKLSRKQLRVAKFLASRGYGREMQGILKASS